MGDPGKARPPRLGIDAHALAARRTGVENYVSGLIEGLAEVAPDADLGLYLHHNPGETLHFRTVRVPKTLAWTKMRLPLHFARHGAPRAMLYPAQGLPLVPGGRSVVTVHDLAFELFPGYFTRADRLRLRLFTRHAARNADRLIAVSHATRDDLVRMLGVPEERIAVVHHGRNPRFAPVPDAAVEEVRRRFRLERPYVLVVGTLQARKNHAALIRALPALHAAGLDVELVMAGGRGWLYDDTMRLIRDLDLEKFVRFLGYVPDEDLPALYTGAAAAALVSLYEGFGFPILESLACGVPTLIADNSSLPEVGGDAVLAVETGRVDAVADGLQRLLCDSELRESLRLRAPAQLERFSWAKTARATLNVMEEIA